jgi:cardiolipin synthase
VRILKDAAENYPAWLEAIAAARRTIHFESYIIHEDAAGHRFAEALASKAREGVRVRLLYDWLGALGHASRRFWRGLRLAGVGSGASTRPGSTARSAGSVGTTGR